MTTDFDRSRFQPRNRFGQLSKNMFFARHVAQPRYLRFITGKKVLGAYEKFGVDKNKNI
jgi:hypothetical protein